MKSKTIAGLIVIVALVALGTVVPVVTAETAEEWNANGVDYAQSLEYEKAIECFGKAIELDPDEGLYYNNRASAYFRLEQYEKAIEDYGKAIELCPYNAFWYYCTVDMPIIS
jgi:tetratricopeptide (TPR) repeat protein